MLPLYNKRVTNNKRGVNEIKKAGRPFSENPKRNDTRIRMTDGEVEKLEYCCKVLGLTKTEVIRQGVDMMYEKAQQQKEE